MTLLSSQSKNPVARNGDLIIVQEKYDSVTAVQLSAGEFLNNRYGRFAHDDIIGKPLGCRWDACIKNGENAKSKKCAGFVHALSPTPELWSLAMQHRTQIVYSHDAAVITLHLDLRPGCTLIEAGTGSGSASVAFARAVAPTGRIRSFEYHQVRAQKARKDFELLGMADVVDVNGGVDVVKSGFIGVNDGEADAVFLDLPAPYLMGKEITRVLKGNGTVCTFSPCVEQVQSSVEMFRNGPFHSIKTITVPVRTYETREQLLGTPGFDELDQEDSQECSDSDQSPVKKRQRTDVEFKGTKRRLKTAGAERIAVSRLGGGRHEGRVLRAKQRLHSKPYSSMKGHTSYLTFARRARIESPTENGVYEKPGETRLNDWKSGNRDSCNTC